MVEQSERLEAKLKLQPLLDREILEQREIHNFRARTVEQISSGVSISVVGRDGIQIGDRECGRIDASHQMPAAAVAGSFMNQIRPVSSQRGCVGGVGSSGNVERQTGLDGDDGVALPFCEHALQDWIRHPEERNFINELAHKTVTDVPVGVAVVGSPVIGNQRRASAVGVGGGVQCVRPGVTSKHLEAMRQPLAKDDTHAFVVGDFIVVDGPDNTKQRVGPPRVDRTRSGKQRSIVVVTAIQVVGMRAEILQLHTATAPKLSFQAGAPLVHPGRGLIPRRGHDRANRRSSGTHAY